MNALNETLNRAYAQAAARNYRAACQKLSEALDTEGLHPLFAGAIGALRDEWKAKALRQAHDAQPWHKKPFYWPKEMECS